MSDDAIELRAERSGDKDVIRELLDEAFEGQAESRLVDALRASGVELTSLVADDDGVVVGHALFSPVTLAGLRGVGLGPMAVRPARQCSGIGTRLIELGIERLRDAGCPFVVVLGHPDYYPRFGFERADRHRVRCEWEVPIEAFMIRILDEAKMKNISGLALYRPEFGATL